MRAWVRMRGGLVRYVGEYSKESLALLNARLDELADLSDLEVTEPTA